MMKYLILCLFLATIFNIAYSRNVHEKSITCFKRKYDGNQLVLEITLKCKHCYTGTPGCTLSITATATLPNGRQMDPMVPPISKKGCQYELFCPSMEFGTKDGSFHIDFTKRS